MTSTILQRKVCIDSTVFAYNFHQIRIGRVYVNTDANYLYRKLFTFSTGLSTGTLFFGNSYSMILYQHLTSAPHSFSCYFRYPLSIYITTYSCILLLYQNIFKFCLVQRPSRDIEQTEGTTIKNRRPQHSLLQRH